MPVRAHWVVACGLVMGSMAASTLTTGAVAIRSRSAPSASAALTAPPGGWTRVGDDGVEPTRVAEADPRPSGRAAAADEGYTLMPNIVGNLGAYTFKLVDSPDVESLRKYVQGTADDLHAVTGGRFAVAPGLTNETTPARGEVLVEVADTSPCGSGGGVIGCGGPQGGQDAGNGNAIATSGMVWIMPAALDLSTDDIQGVMSHEAGHAMGLAHYADSFDGSLQVMNPVDQGIPKYQAGDQNGLKFLYGNHPALTAYDPFASWDAFVAQQLSDFTGAAGTTSSRSSTVSTLSAGDVQPAAYVETEMHGAWFAGTMAPVARLYWAYFGRIPDHGGLEYWTGRHRAGTSINMISQSFATSAEFKAKYGALTNQQFVTRIYADVMGRPSDTSGAAYWTGQLDAKKRDRGSVMTGFSESAEYKAKKAADIDIVLAYTGMLDRSPSTDELTSGEALTITALIDQLRAGTEYAGRVA